MPGWVTMSPSMSDLRSANWMWKRPGERWRPTRSWRQSSLPDATDGNVHEHIRLSCGSTHILVYEPGHEFSRRSKSNYAVTYTVLKFLHLLGLTLIGAGLIGVWYADLRFRQVQELLVFAESVRTVAVLYDGLVVPGALLLLGSETWLIVTVYGGWAFLGMPWLAGMVALFAFEFIEGNTITRLYFMRLRRLAREAVQKGKVTAELEEARRRYAPTFTHFLDIPILFVIVALGAMRPNSWAPFVIGTGLALVAAAILTVVIPRLYPLELGENRR